MKHTLEKGRIEQGSENVFIFYFLFYFILFYFILFYFILFYFILFYLFK